MTIAQLIAEKLDTLPPEKQQEVLDFVEFLQAKFSSNLSPVSDHQSVSFLEAASEFVGCLEGPGDLSTNPKYMEGFGES
jgi:hypothetical protein